MKSGFLIKLPHTILRSCLYENSVLWLVEYCGYCSLGHNTTPQLWAQFGCRRGRGRLWRCGSGSIWLLITPFIQARHIQKHLLENTCEEMPFNTRHLTCFSWNVLGGSFKVRVMRTWKFCAVSTFHVSPLFCFLKKKKIDEKLAWIRRWQIKLLAL